MNTGERARRVVGALVVLVVVLVGGVAGQTTPQKAAPKPKTADELKELKKEVRELQDGQEAIRRELRELRESLKKGPPAPSTVSIGGRPFRGNENARLVIVEFSDYQCPYCGLFFREALPQLDREYIQSGKIKYVFSNLPLDDIHPLAFKASQAAECAGEQGKFWELHDWMFANQKKLAQVDVAAQAKTLGLDMAKFNQCLAGDKAAALVKANAEEAESLGIDGTPSFVLGLVDAKNPGDTNIRVIGMLGGAQPFSVFKTAIEKALAMK